MNEERGIITRIYLENFVTYDKVVIRPSRNLNLIIGPNGTGKSTIVCAIVIGFGGKPKLIGRATTVGDYVKTGCDSAKIEIELKDANNESITIVRNFNKANQTTWKLNGRDAHNKEIRELVKSLNIQVDNLCQFLPQDKVQDFSKMNSQELLENTERSVGDSRLLEYHVKLKDYRKRGKEFETIVANKSRLLESETQKYKGMKEIVGSIKERKAIKKRIKTLKQKRAWISYDHSRKQLCEAKKGRDEAAAEMKKLDNKLRPIQAAISKLELSIKELKKTAEIHNTQLSTKTSKVVRLKDEIQNKEREMREIEINREHKIQAEENRDLEINIIVQQKNKLDNDLQVLITDVGTEEGLVAEQRRVNLELQQKRSEVEKLTKEMNASRAQLENIDSTIRMIAAEMKSAKDVDTKRLELLRQRSADAHKGVLWLRENREKFSSVIHEPIMLTIDVKDADYSKYFENVISYRDLVAFVCEDKTDMNRLLGYLRGQLKLKINVVHSDPHKNVQMTPNIPLEQLKQFGFQHYLISLIEAPETIIKYLVTMNRIHNIPIGTTAVEENVDHVPSNLRFYFSQNNSFGVGSSKYTRAKSTRMSRVRGNGSLSIIQDTNKLRQLKKKLEELHGSKEHVLVDIKDLEVRLKAANDELEIRRTARQQSQRNVQTIQALKTRISVAERKILDLQNSRTSVEEIKAAAIRDIQKVLKTQLQLYVQYNSLVSDCLKFVTTNGRMKFELELQKRKFRIKTDESQDLRDRCALAEETYKRLESALMPLKNETERLYQVAMDSTDRVKPQDADFKPINAAFAKLPVTMEEIDTELETAQAKVYCLGNNVDGEAILANYERTRANVEKLKNEIEEMNVEQTTIEQQVEEIRGLWLTPLNELVERINSNFSTYFNLMGCAGEVTLKQADNVHDFDQYGLMIRVKFRDADELQELTRQRQSGGERAVTTAVYMIALQELSRVPFRCVDEINQGMDAVNERRVFELIVQITGRANNSQYFFLTPKLLPDLEYGTHVTVHCVFNGPFVIPSTEFDTSSYCTQLRRLSRR